MVKRILIIELAGIGDLVMASAAIREIRKEYPQAYIAVLTLARAQELIRHCPYADELFIFYEGCLAPPSIWRNLCTTLRMRRKRFDIAANIYTLYTRKGACKIRALLSLIRAKKTLGRDTNGRGGFYDIKVGDYFPLRKHQVECIMDVARAMGSAGDDHTLEVWTGDAAQKDVERFMEQMGLSASDCIIGVNPGAVRSSHRWPVEYFAQAADVLAEKYHAKIVVTGSKKEISLSLQLANMMRQKPVVTTGLLSLSQLSALIGRCRLYVSNDSGPMHIANALGRPLVAIMGPGPLEYGPYHKRDVAIVRKEAACSPCFKSYCRDMKCLNSITPDDVVGAAEGLLQSGL